MEYILCIRCGYKVNSKCLTVSREIELPCSLEKLLGFEGTFENSEVINLFGLFFQHYRNFHFPPAETKYFLSLFTQGAEVFFLTEEKAHEIARETENRLRQTTALSDQAPANKTK